MKQITKMSRLTGQLEKIFRLINADLFDDVLPEPVITVIPTSRAYGHYTPYSAWNVAGTGKPEINIASGTLDRPIEEIVETMLHEAVHLLNDRVLNIQDTSRNGTYHNKRFREAAEAHGLKCTRTEKYGWAFTELTEETLLWIIEHDELREIEMCRVAPFGTSAGTGTHSNSNGTAVTGTNPNSHSKKWICPCCGTCIRSTKKTVNILCMDCNEQFIEG